MMSVVLYKKQDWANPKAGEGPTLYELNRDGAFVVGSDIGDERVNALL